MKWKYFIYVFCIISFKIYLTHLVFGNFGSVPEFKVLWVWAKRYLQYLSFTIGQHVRSVHYDSGLPESIVSVTWVCVWRNKSVQHIQGSPHTLVSSNTVQSTHSTQESFSHFIVDSSQVIRIPVIY